MSPDRKDSQNATRLRILETAKRLLAEGGRDALTTRMVAKGAGVPQPTLYRLIGDKSVLIATLIEDELSRYVAEKSQRVPDPDPVENLRRSWDMHVQFGLDNPTIFILMWGSLRPGKPIEADAKGLAYTARLIRDIALAGRLTQPEETAADLVVSGCVGATLKLLTKPEGERDMGLSTKTREAVIAAITAPETNAKNPDLASAATVVKARLPLEGALTQGERMLLRELLDKVIAWT